MPLINLIQQQRFASRSNARKARSFFFLFAGSLVASVGAYAFVLFQKEMLQSEEAKLQGELQANAPMVKQTDENTKQVAQLQPRLTTLEDAQTVSGRWGRILGKLATQTPTNAWLTAVRTTAADQTKPITISFTGVSPAQEPISEFILRMQNQADLQNVTLKFTQEKLVQTSKGIEFQVDAEIVGTEAQKPRDDGKEEKKK